MAENSNQQEINGWADVKISSEMPINMVVNFLNVLNQRLVEIENVLKVQYEGQEITLTEFYRIQAEAEQEVARKQMEE